MSAALSLRVRESEYKEIQDILIKEFRALACVGTERLQGQIFSLLQDTFKHDDTAKRFTEFVNKNKVYLCNVSCVQ